jgi:hypothetical protein
MVKCKDVYKKLGFTQGFAKNTLIQLGGGSTVPKKRANSAPSSSHENSLGYI